MTEGVPGAEIRCSTIVNEPLQIPNEGNLFTRLDHLRTRPVSAQSVVPLGATLSFRLPFYIYRGLVSVRCRANRVGSVIQTQVQRFHSSGRVGPPCAAYACANRPRSSLATSTLTRGAELQGTVVDTATKRQTGMRATGFPPFLPPLLSAWSPFPPSRPLPFPSLTPFT